MPKSADTFAPSADSPDAEPLLLDLVDHLDAMVAYWDSKQVCRFANMAYKDWFGRGRKELLGTTLRELLGPLYEMNLPHIEAAYRGERQVFERAIPRPDGSGMRHSLATYIPRVVGGQVVGMFVHVADIEPIKRLEGELRAARDEALRLATHDHLTGLPNRLLLRDRAAEAIARARRTGDKVYLLTVDVDNFKLVNDSYGHPVGDQLLIDIAGRIKSCVRDYDTVARIGGDEFVVLTTGGPLKDGIEALATRMLERVRQPAQIGPTVVTPSISVGIAEFPRHGSSLDSLKSVSDRALYAAKHAGKSGFALGEPE